MSEGIVVSLDSFRKKVNGQTDPKEKITEICSEMMFDSVHKLNNCGYDVNDPDLLYDLEIVTRLLAATLSRQDNIEDSNVEILDQLRQADEESI